MERKRDASRKLAETTQKHFLPVNSAPGDKAGIPAPPEHPPLVDPVVRAAWGCCSLGDAPPGGSQGLGQVGLEVLESSPETSEGVACERPACLISPGSGQWW